MTSSIWGDQANQKDAKSGKIPTETVYSGQDNTGTDCQGRISSPGSTKSTGACPHKVARACHPFAPRILERGCCTETTLAGQTLPVPPMAASPEPLSTLPARMVPIGSDGNGGRTLPLKRAGSDLARAPLKTAGAGFAQSPAALRPMTPFPRVSLPPLIEGGARVKALDDTSWRRINVMNT